MRGRDFVTGLPKTVQVSSTDIRRAIETAVITITDTVRTVLDVCPPELAGDILDNGVTLTGGCAQLRSWTERLKHELGVPVQVAEEPLQAVEDAGHELVAAVGDGPAFVAAMAAGAAPQRPGRVPLKEDMIPRPGDRSPPDRPAQRDRSRRLSGGTPTRPSGL